MKEKSEAKEFFNRQKKEIILKKKIGWEKYNTKLYLLNERLVPSCFKVSS